MEEPAEIARLRLLAAHAATRPYTVDDIAENLEEGTYLGREQAMLTAIAQTITRLPREVQDFALFNLRFTSIGGDYRAITWPGQLFSMPVSQGREHTAEDILAPPGDKAWVIVLDTLMLDDPSPEETLSTIAHEIAHAWRGHDCRPGAVVEEPEGDIERAAAVQAHAWGFQGRAADARSYNSASSV